MSFIHQSSGSGKDKEDPFLYLRVYVPLGSEKLANEGKFPFWTDGELSDGSAIGPVGGSLRQRLRRRRSQGKEELIEQSDNLTEAWPHVWVLHPTRLHYERQTRRYPLWHYGPLLLECCCVGGLQIGHALEWHTISEKLPKHDSKAVDINFVVVMLLLSLTQGHCTVELRMTRTQDMHIWLFYNVK